MGIEPTYSAWKAEVLPLNYTRATKRRIAHQNHIKTKKMVEGGGFEPPKAEPSDLQSDPFGHSGTPPRSPAFCKIGRLLSTNFPVIYSTLFIYFHRQRGNHKPHLNCHS
jgi:hypothetical protein